MGQWSWREAWRVWWQVTACWLVIYAALFGVMMMFAVLGAVLDR